ncbi:hypothetical protein DV735_g510, partial [Chaetothyriales sp. CBS 134920]
MTETPPAPIVHQPVTASGQRQLEPAANSTFDPSPDPESAKHRHTSTLFQLATRLAKHRSSMSTLTRMMERRKNDSGDDIISEEELDSILARQIPFDQLFDLMISLSSLIDDAFPASERQDTHYRIQADFLLLLSNLAQILRNFHSCFHFLALFVTRKKASNQSVDHVLACLDHIFPSVHMGMVSLRTTTRLRTMIVLDFVKTLVAELCNKMQLCASRLDPFLGLDLFMRLGKAAVSRRYLETLQQWFQDQGSTFGANMMGELMIFTNEPQNIQAMLVTKFPDFVLGQRRRDNSVPLLGVGIFNADGAAWEHGRALVRPNFTRKQVADLAMFEKHVQVMLAGLPGKGEHVEMQEWFFRFTLDVGTDVLFDKSSEILRPDGIDTARRFAWAFDKGIDGVSQKLRMGKFAWLFYDSKYTDACKYVQDYVDTIVEEAIQRRQTQNWHSKDKSEMAKDTEERYTFLNALIDEGTSPKEIRNQLLNTLIAARDTSACLMSAAMFELARNGSCQDKLRSEIGRLNGSLPVLEDMKEMRYLNTFLKEVLRLYPPIPLNSRFAQNDTVLPRGGGKDGRAPIFIPKGQLVVYQVYSMHRREDLWGPDAHLFQPERWETMRPRFEYLPFNAGPRICLGQQFALAETSYILIRLLQSFSEIRAVDPDGVWTENLTITCSVGSGVWVTMKE